MDYDYVIDVVAGSKACMAGYSAVQAYITAVWAYHKRLTPLTTKSSFLA